MSGLDLTLTPAQWEHYDRHGWTLVAAPTTVQLPDAAGAYPVGPAAPVPATVPCPECEGSRSVGEPGYTYCGIPEPGSYEACPRCMDDHGIPTGVVPRTVGITRPERECPECGGMRDVAAADEPNPMPCARCKGLGHFPAERVGTATVTPVPVVDERGWLHDNDTPAEAMVVELDDSLVLVSHHEQFDASALFATPPAPGTTVWRLDRNEER